MLKKTLLCLLLISGGYSVINAQGNRLSKKEIKRLDAFSKVFTGVFDNLHTVEKSHGEIKAQEMRSFRFWKNKKDAYWFYSGWFMPSWLENPLADGLFKIIPEDEKTFRVELYHVPLNYSYALPWEELKPFADLEEEDLIKGGCLGKIRENRKGAFILKTTANCMLRDKPNGLHFIELHLECSRKKVVSYTNFYDKDEAFVFGFTDGQAFDLKSRIMD